MGEETFRSKVKPPVVRRRSEQTIAALHKRRSSTCFSHISRNDVKIKCDGSRANDDGNRNEPYVILRYTRVSFSKTPPVYRSLHASTHTCVPAVAICYLNVLTGRSERACIYRIIIILSTAIQLPDRMVTKFWWRRVHVFRTRNVSLA